MNCESVHRRLLALECPNAPPADVRQHLAACVSCRTWHEQFLAAEREVPFLPVPPPVRRAEFLRTLREKPPVPVRPRLLRPAPEGKRERGLKKAALAVALAASLLMVALGAWLWKDGPPSPSRPAVVKKSPLEQHLEADARWTEARTPLERVSLLDILASEVEGKALALSRGSSGEELTGQVRFYREIIDRLTVTEAPSLGKPERAKVLDPIARRLREVESEAKRLALGRPEMAGSLNELALIAAEGDRKLRTLLL